MLISNLASSQDQFIFDTIKLMWNTNNFIFIILETSIHILKLTLSKKMSKIKLIFAWSTENKFNCYLILKITHIFNIIAENNHNYYSFIIFDLQKSFEVSSKQYVRLFLANIHNYYSPYVSHLTSHQTRKSLEVHDRRQEYLIFKI